MNIKNDLESNYLAVHSPNIIELEGCEGDVTVSVTGADVNIGFTRRVFNEEVRIDLEEVGRLIYQTVGDSFDYSADDTLTLNAHILDFDDGVGLPITKSIRFINGALQIGDTSTMESRIGSLLHHYDCDANKVVDETLTQGHSVSNVDTFDSVGYVWTAPTSAPLTRFIAQVFNDTDVTIEIFTGNGFGGTLIHTEVVPDANWQGGSGYYTLSSEVPMVQGNVYTMRFTVGVTGGYYATSQDSGWVQFYSDGASSAFYYGITLRFEGIINQNGVAPIVWEGYPYCISTLANTEIEREAVSDGSATPSSATCEIVVENGCEGAYLKWLNEFGGWDYWLFSQKYETKRKHKEIGIIQNNFQDRGSAQSVVNVLGVESGDSLSLATFIPRKYKDHIGGLLSSNEVYLYNAEFESGENKWLRCRVKGGTTSLGRRYKNRIEFKTEIELPQRYSQRL